MCRLSVAQYFLTLLSFFRASLQCIRFISDDSLINRKEIWNLFKSKLFVYSFSRFHSFCMLEISCCGWGKEMGGVGEGKGGRGGGYKQPGRFTLGHSYSFEPAIYIASSIILNNSVKVRNLAIYSVT